MLKLIDKFFLVFFGFPLTSTKQPDGLLSVLIDVEADDDDRIESTYRLHEYEFESKRIEIALESVISDPRSSSDLIENCKDTIFLIEKIKKEKLDKK